MQSRAESGHRQLYIWNTYCIYAIFRSNYLFQAAYFIQCFHEHSLLCFLHEQEVIWSYSFSSFCEGLPSLNLAWHIKAATFVQTERQTHTLTTPLHIGTVLVHTYSIQYNTVYICTVCVYICTAYVYICTVTINVDPYMHLSPYIHTV